MDFHTLSRKELQTLCKKNKIPANITNVAMADALSALPQVEGLDEILDPREGDIGTPAVQPRTACRTTTQRKPVKEPESSKVAVTPAVVPSSRRRVTAVSTRRKKEVIVIDDDEGAVVAKTPAVVPSSRTKAVQSAYSTRRSVRLLGKSLSKISLVDTEDMEQTKVDDVSEEISSLSQHEESSVDTEKGASLQTESTVVSQKTDEVEVSSVDKAHCESQSHDSGSEVKSTDAVDVLQAEPELDLEKVNHVEGAQEEPSSNLQDSFETCVDSNEAGSEQPELEESGDSIEIVAESEEASMETSDKAIDDPLTVLVPEDACEDVSDQEDVTVLSVEVSEETSDEIDQVIVGLSAEASEEVSEEIADQSIATLTAEVPDGAMDISSEEHKIDELLELKPAVLTEKDETSRDSEAENEVSIQSFEEEKESNEVDKVILQLSMLDVVEMKEDQKDTSEKLKAEAQVEESKGETNQIGNEIQAVPNTQSGLGNPNMMKENMKTIDLQSVSLRALKKELKKMEGKLKTDNGDAKMQEMETKRTALQALPQNL